MDRYLKLYSATIEEFLTSQPEGPYPLRAKWRLIGMGVILALPHCQIGHLNLKASEPYTDTTQ